MSSFNPKSYVTITLVAVVCAFIGYVTGIMIGAKPSDSNVFTSTSSLIYSTSLIHVSVPKPQAIVSSPLFIAGEARGSWYFEATFPVVLENSKGVVLAQTPARATSDWMTDQFVPFTANITFPPQPSGNHGMLILKKDNPSGLPAHDASVEIPVIFK